MLSIDIIQSVNCNIKQQIRRESSVEQWSPAALGVSTDLGGVWSRDVDPDSAGVGRALAQMKRTTVIVK